jgi:5-methylcytosine-specific restriction enzyme B
MIDSTTRENIVDSLKSWDRTSATQRAVEAEQLRVQFVERFPITSWPQLAIEDYALGQSTHDTVSWWIEYKTRVIGSVSGGSAYKHLIFKARNEIWRFPPEFGSVEQAWAAIRDGFVQILSLAENGQFDDVDDIKALTSAPAVRTKLLYMYFPGDLIPVSSKGDIDHYLQAIGEEPASSAVRGNRQLLAGLRAIPELGPLSNQELGFFVYHWNNPRPSQRVVKIAPGERGKFWDDCIENGFICTGWEEVGDLSQYESKDAFREAFRERFRYNGVESQVSRKANELWTLMELLPGDTVIANRGVSEVLGVGTVNDVGYVWRADREEYNHTLGVDWDTSAAKVIEPVRAWATTTVSKVPAVLARRILGTAISSKPVETDQKYLDLETALHRGLPSEAVSNRHNATRLD